MRTAAHNQRTCPLPDLQQHTTDGVARQTQALMLRTSSVHPPCGWCSQHVCRHGQKSADGAQQRQQPARVPVEEPSKDHVGKSAGSPEVMGLAIHFVLERISLKLTPCTVALSERKAPPTCTKYIQREQNEAVL